MNESVTDCVIKNVKYLSTSLMRHLLGVTDEERLRKREEILTTRFVNFTLSTICVTKSFRLVLIIFLCEPQFEGLQGFRRGNRCG